MCCQTIWNETVFRPGNKIPVISANKLGHGDWAGFIRSETLASSGYWQREGFTVKLDHPASSYAEKNVEAAEGGTLHRQTLKNMAKDEVIYCMGNRKNGQVKMITRDPTANERMYFVHAKKDLRIPLTGPPRFNHDLSLSGEKNND